MKTANFSDARDYLIKNGMATFSSNFDYVSQACGSEEDLPDISSLDAMIAKRTITLNGEITSDNTSIVQGLMMYLDSVSTEPITLLINSDGGSVYAGLGILDTMEFVSSKVYTKGVGTVASMAAVILSAGAKGHRSVANGTRIVLSAPLYVNSDAVADVALEVDKLSNEISSILSENTGQPVNLISGYCRETQLFTADQAKCLGLIDSVTAS